MPYWVLLHGVSRCNRILNILQRSLISELDIAMVVTLSVVLATMLASSQAGLPMNCRSVVYPKANTPLACVMITRTELGSPSLDLDIGKWGTVSQLSTDSDPADSGYNDLLMNWVKQPSSSTGFPTGSTGTKNPSIADSMTALNPNLLPGACRYAGILLNMYFIHCSQMGPRKK